MNLFSYPVGFWSAEMPLGCALADECSYAGDGLEANHEDIAEAMLDMGLSMLKLYLFIGKHIIKRASYDKGEAAKKL